MRSVPRKVTFLCSPPGDLDSWARSLPADSRNSAGSRPRTFNPGSVADSDRKVRPGTRTDQALVRSNGVADPFKSL